MHVASRCRLSGIEFELLGSVPENLLKASAFPTSQGSEAQVVCTILQMESSAMVTSPLL